MNINKILCIFLASCALLIDCTNTKKDSTIEKQSQKETPPIILKQDDEKKMVTPNNDTILAITSESLITDMIKNYDGELFFIIRRQYESSTAYCGTIFIDKNSTVRGEFEGEYYIMVIGSVQFREYEIEIKFFLQKFENFAPLQKTGHIGWFECTITSSDIFVMINSGKTNPDFYVVGELLSTNEDTQSGIINNNNVCLRSTTNLDADSFYVFAINDRVEIIDRSPQKQKIGDMEAYWYKVYTLAFFPFSERQGQEKIGWVYGAYVDIIEENTKNDNPYAN